MGHDRLMDEARRNAEGVVAVTHAARLQTPEPFEQAMILLTAAVALIEQRAGAAGAVETLGAMLGPTLAEWSSRATERTH